MRHRFVYLLSVAACAAVAALVVPGPAYAAPKDDGVRSWSLRPAGPDGKPDSRTHFTLQSELNQKVSDKALLTNQSKVPVAFNVYGTDAFNTAKGDFDLLSAAKRPVDIGAWMTFPGRVVTVPAGKTVVIPFTIAVPPNASPGDHVGGVVASLADVSGGDRVNVDTRVALRVYLRVPGLLRPLLSISNVGANFHAVTNPFGKGKATVRYTVDNPGNIRLRAHVTITVKSAFGTTLAKVTPPDLPELLPNGNVTFTTEVGRIFPAGPVTVQIGLAPLPDPQQPVGQAIAPVSASGSLWAISWTLASLIVLVILLALSVWLMLRRRLRSRLDRAMLAAREEALTEKTTIAGGVSS